MYRSDPNNATADKTAQTQIILVLPKTHSPLFYRFQREKNAEVGIAIQESLYQEQNEHRFCRRKSVYFKRDGPTRSDLEQQQHEQQLRGRLPPQVCVPASNILYRETRIRFSTDGLMM